MRAAVRALVLLSLLVLLAGCLGSSPPSGTTTTPPASSSPPSATTASPPSDPTPRGDGSGPDPRAQFDPRIVAQSKPDCAGTRGILSFGPTAPNETRMVTPLGNLAPPGHTIPTIHMYWGVNASRAVDVRAPADIIVTQISSHDNGQAEHPFNSYRVDFVVCKQMFGYYFHLLTLSDELNASFKEPYDGCTAGDVGGARPDVSCVKRMRVALRAGDIMGTTGGGPPGSAANIDFGLEDDRLPPAPVANPARWNGADRNQVCALDYMPTDLAASYLAELGDTSGNPIHPGDPACGVIYQDQPGTAQGVWLATDVPPNVLYSSEGQLSLVHSSLDHAMGVFAFGTEAGRLGIDVNHPYPFRPTRDANASVDRDFDLVKPGDTVCYEVGSAGYGTQQPNAIVVHVENATSLRVAVLASPACGGGPWSLADGLAYVR